MEGVRLILVAGLSALAIAYCAKGNWAHGTALFALAFAHLEIFVLRAGRR